MPTDCRVVLQLQAECFRKQDDATMKVASTHATPSTHSPIDGRNIAPPVIVHYKNIKCDFFVSFVIIRICHLYCVYTYYTLYTAIGRV